MGYIEAVAWQIVDKLAKNSSLSRQQMANVIIDELLRLPEFNPSPFASHWRDDATGF
jgi:hypothetical protein